MNKWQRQVIVNRCVATLMQIENINPRIEKKEFNNILDNLAGMICSEFTTSLRKAREIISEARIKFHNLGHEIEIFSGRDRNQNSTLF